MTAGRPDYFCSVAAVDSNGDIGELSKNVRVTVPGTPTPTLSLTQTPTPTTTPGQTPTPTPTSNVTGKLLAPTLNAPSTATNAVDLSWTEVFGAVRYVLFEWDEVNLWRQIGGDNLTGTSYSQKNVTAGTTYVYTVAAVDVNNLWGHLSAQKRVILSGAWGILPAPPLTATSTVATTVELRWTEVTHAVKYDLWTWWDSTIGWQRINDSLKGASYIHRGLTPGTTYYYAIRAVDANGAAGPLTESPFPEATVIDSSVIQDAAEEKAALVALYNATNGPNWTHSDNWLSPEPLSTWHGVTTNTNGRVTRLDLASNGLSGPIPDLSPLTSLTSLALSFNQLTGSIPDLSALTNLTGLYLYNNQLTGPFPDLSALTNLRSLSLAGNPLSGQMPDLSTLTNLRSLALTATQLCLPDGASLSHPNSVIDAHLQSLNLPSCTPAGPDERAALVALYNATDGANWTHNDNWLSAEPIDTWYRVNTDAYGHVARLVLQDNGLNGPIPDLSALPSLTTLFLANNQLSGEIPELSAFTRLTSLVLDSNDLRGPIRDLPALTNLRTLSLSGNDLSGPIPDLSALTNLRSLYLGFNDLSGPIPDLSAHTNLWSLHLTGNDLSGPIPDLSALTNLTELNLGDNRLSGQLPDLSAFINLASLSLGGNDLSGPIPDLSALTNLRRLSLGSNQLNGQIPDLATLTNLTYLYLNNNQLTGQIPDLDALTLLTRLDLSHNQLSGQIPDLSALTLLTVLNLSHNQLSGPVPDLSALTNLTRLDLTGNGLCLPAGADLSGYDSAVTTHLNSLNLATCTDAELATVPGVPQNLNATVGAAQVTLAWDAAANAVSYELQAWDSLDRQWGAVGGVLTDTTTYTHTVLTDGRNYYYRVRSRNASNVHGGWSEWAHAIIVPAQFPPPPLSLGLDIFYQKYLEVDGVVVVASTDVSDETMIQVGAIITGMLSVKPDLLGILVANRTRIAIYPYSEQGERINQLPEFRFLTNNTLGYVHKGASEWLAGVPAETPYCGTVIHEIAHLVQNAIEEQPGGTEFNSRLQAAYQAALNAGRWQGLYARTNTEEYWAEAVKFWFWESLPPSLAPSGTKLADYDPEIAMLVVEALDGAIVPAACKP